MVSGTDAGGVDRTDAGRSRVLLAGGDALAVAAVLLVGELRHGISPLGRPGRVAQTILPFLLAWFAVATLVGVYDRDRSISVFRLTAGGWLGAANLGLIARNSPYLAGGTTWPFGLVVTGFVLVALLAWRALATYRLTRSD